MKNERLKKGNLLLDTINIVELFENEIHAGNIVGITPQIKRVMDFLKKELKIVEKSY